MNAQVPLVTTPERVRLKVADYLSLDAKGAFAEYGKTELIDGDVYYMNAQHRPHARIKSRLAQALNVALEGFPGLEALVEASIEILPHSVPEPDIVVTSEPEGEGFVPLASVRLVVEISDTTLETDLGRKADLYAAAGVPEYWVVDLNEKRVLIHANPRGDGSGYDGQIDLQFGERLIAATVEGLVVDGTVFG